MTKLPKATLATIFNLQIQLLKQIDEATLWSMNHRRPPTEVRAIQAKCTFVH